MLSIVPIFTIDCPLLSLKTDQDVQKAGNCQKDKQKTQKQVYSKITTRYIRDFNLPPISFVQFVPRFVPDATSILL